MTKLIFTLGCAIVALVVFSVAPVYAYTSTSGNLKAVNMKNQYDYFYNYDFWSESILRTNVDNCIDIVFINNANINKVKNDIYWGTCGHTPINAAIKDWPSPTWYWDSDRGTTYTPIAGFRYHMRLYADSDDRIGYSGVLGYYVIGSCHYDASPYSGFHEYCEDDMRNRAREKGYSVHDNWVNLYNREAPRIDGDHYWFNNGWASEVLVP